MRAPRSTLLARITRLIAAAVAPALLLVTGAGACLSPTLPLPPPELPQNLHDRGDGIWSVQGNCIAGAEVIVLNEATGLGAVIIDTDQNGGYYVEIKASVCDYVTIQQSFNSEESGKSGFIIEPLTNGVPDGPSVCSQ